jgi:hypothetical protein
MDDGKGAANSVELREFQEIKKNERPIADNGHF